MATTNTTSTNSTTSTRFAVGSFATPALADDPAASTSIIECRSGIVTEGDVAMSAMSVTRFPTAELGDTPGDCSQR